MSHSEQTAREIAEEIVKSNLLKGEQGMLHMPVTFYETVIIEAITEALERERLEIEAGKAYARQLADKGIELEAEIERLKSEGRGGV